MISLTGKRGAKGFTVVEALVSVVILMAGVIVIDQVLLSAMSRLSFLEHRFEANRLLNGKVWETRDFINRTGAGPKSYDDGVLMGNERVYNYAMKSKPLGSGGTLYQADFRISWTEAGWAKKILRSYYFGIPHENPAE